jgi:(E)-4-hydroxy-3-methyl-but-2-enyl pyrophosphate reductase
MPDCFILTENDRASSDAPLSERRVLLANPRGFCAGVERAIAAVESALDQCGAPVYVRRAIVHNSEVVARLEALGAVFVQEIDEIPHGAAAILSAHGSAAAIKDAAKARQLRLADAICPLVAKVHNEVIAWHAASRHVLLIGHPGHPELVGTLGQVPAHAVSVITSLGDVATLALPAATPVAYAVQTTFAQRDAAALIAAISAQFTDVQGPRASDICYATSNRQNAIEGIARDAELVLVVGDRMSSNAQRLVEVARAAGAPAQLVSDPADLPTALIAQASTIGLTAAASTPESAVLRICDALVAQGFTLYEAAGLRESMRFKPVDLAPLR